MNKAIFVIFVMFISYIDVASQPGFGTDFLEIASNRLGVVNDTQTKADSSKKAFSKVCPIDSSPAAKKILTEYGAIFVASGNVDAPPTCQFRGDAEVAAFQEKLKTSIVPIDGNMLRLQKPAAESLNAAIVDALSHGLTIRALDGSIAGGRNYSDTLRLWNSRLDPALQFWVARGRISAEEAASFTQLPLEQQITKVMEWEEQGMRFGTNRRSSIFASTAPPGASQHLSLLAIDIASMGPTVVTLMNDHGWFQTVVGDRGHFTYLGLTEKELPGRGLKALDIGATRYWVPNIASDMVSNP